MKAAAGPRVGGYRDFDMTEKDQPAPGSERGVLSYEMTVAEWLGTGAMLAAPYLLIGLLWAATHTGGFAALYGPDRVVAFLRVTVFWPMLLFTVMCLP
ncbi:MAG: hypothetical protein P4L86_21430 [Mycobacterium sp.]|nr:hypothetical protein [Mycobacterium sp.]